MNRNNKHPDPDQLQSYLDRSLNSSDLTELESHLAGCTTCQSELNQMEVILARLEKLPVISLDKDLTESILSQLSAKKQSSPGITWTLVIEALAAGTVLGILIPVFQVANWISSLINTRQEILIGLNIFLTQLASSWIVWLAQLQLNIQSFLESLQAQNDLTAGLPSPWILVLAAGGLGVLINYLILKDNPLKDHQPQH